jgi:hypothetical protein
MTLPWLSRPAPSPTSLTTGTGRSRTGDGMAHSFVRGDRDDRAG